MLIQFSVANFKTFKKKAVLSLIASNYDKTTLEDSNIITINKYNLRLLKSAVMYGANASGKSKFIEALQFMKMFVFSSAKNSQVDEEINIEPFKLNSESEKAPTEFEAVFLHNGDLFRYGFEVDKKRVVAEWLYHRPHTKEVELFYREGQKFDIHKEYKKGKLLYKEKLVRKESLMLSVAAQFNDELARKILNWFNNFKVLSGLEEMGYSEVAIDMISRAEDKRRVLSLLEVADICIKNISRETKDLETMRNELPDGFIEFIKNKTNQEKVKVFSGALTAHPKYDSNNKYIEDVTFSMGEDESHGTQKFFYLTGPLLDVLKNGYILVIDELDSRLHPNLVNKIVALFNSSTLNPHNAQLIFNTHDTRLLSSGLFRRDQLWFIEKDRYGAATLYSLSSFKSDKVRKEDNFEERYLEGRYGAIPYLNHFDEELKSQLAEKP